MPRPPRRRGRRSHLAEVNLTPLMDLAFLLLITFIIAVPLIESGIEVNLPKASASPVDPEKTRTITVAPEGALYLDGTPIDEATLRAEMERFAMVSDEHAVLVRADESLRYSRVVEILQILYDARVTRMALVTQGEGG